MTPVRAILGYQEIIVEEAQRLRLDDVAPHLQTGCWPPPAH